MAISAKRVSERLAGTEELALLDVREQGVHYRGHPFYAVSAPLSRLELMIGDLVPRNDVPIIVLDGGNEGLAEKAASRLGELKYSNVSLMEGGCEGWKKAGLELFSGVNVPSKAFGEFVEHHYQTPRIPPEELKKLLAEKRKLVILDSRPFEEYRRMSIPGGIDAPGAELVWRVHDVAPEPDTLVVVNCAGRTRSIIGCQSLRNAGIPNEVVALKDGTMGWDLAGFECERGAGRIAPAPTLEGREKALRAAERVSVRYDVKFVDGRTVAGWQGDRGRTLYLLDVRTREEFERSHVAGARHAPGGQLVQASDEYVGVRHARVVLVDKELVRAVMTASWLNQMGWDDVYDEPALPLFPRARRMVGRALAARRSRIPHAQGREAGADIGRRNLGAPGRPGGRDVLARRESARGRQRRLDRPDRNRDGARDDGARRCLVQAVRSRLRLQEARARVPELGSRAGGPDQARPDDSFPQLLEEDA